MPPKQEVTAQKFSTPRLLARSIKALFRWGKTGFTLVDKTVLERRENACLACPNLQAPVVVIQTLVFVSSTTERPGQRTGNRVCALCGCVASKKMLLASEACPGIDPERGEFTRWGEAVS